LKKTISKIFKFILFVGIGVTILVILYNKLNAGYQLHCAANGIPDADCNLVHKVIEDFKSARYIWLVIIVICFMISNVHRAIRWKYLLDSLGYKTRFWNGFHAIMVMYFTNLGFPRIGEIIRAGTVSRYEKIPFEKVFGTATVDRIMDMISMLIVFLLALTLEFDTLWSYIQRNAVRLDLNAFFSSTPFFIALVAIVLIGILAVVKRKWLFSLNLVQKFVELGRGFLEGLKSIAKLKNIPAFIFHSVMIWVMYYLMLYLCFFSFEPTSHLGPLPALMVFIFGSLGMLVPAPGGMGSYHALVVAGLMLYGVSEFDAFSFAMIVFFTIQIFGNILFGIIGLILLPIYNKGYQPVTAHAKNNPPQDPIIA
jgi:uncharacterized protein (TIRG00374 family)